MLSDYQHDNYQLKKVVMNVNYVISWPRPIDSYASQTIQSISQVFLKYLNRSDLNLYK